MNPRTKLRIGGVLLVAGFLLTVGAFGGAWALTPDRSSTPDDLDANVSNTSVLVGVQGPGPGGQVTELHANGTVAWTYEGGTGGSTISYQNVLRLDDGTVLTTFADDGYRECGSVGSPCKRTGVRIVDPHPEPTQVSEWSYPIRTREDSEVHDAELLPSGEVLVADMEYESIFTYDRSTGERTWTWNASDHYDEPRDPPAIDWLHLNDVDRIGDGRYLVSIRNANQLLIVERGEGVVEVINENEDEDVLYHQHNPHWLGDGRILVADSENDRVVELHRNETTGTWEVAWAVTGAGGIAFDWPRDADRLPNGNTVVTDSRNDRVVVVDEEGNLVRSYATAPLPYEADVLPYGERAGLENGTAAASEGTIQERSSDVPILSRLLAAAHHAAPVPYWVSELHLLVVAVTLALWSGGGWLVVGSWRAERVAAPSANLFGTPRSLLPYVMATEQSSTTDEYSVYVPDREDAEPFPIDFDDGVQIDLIEATGMEEMRARLWFLEPGDSMSFHYHDEQEELFYVVRGTGHVLIGEDRELVEVPEGGMVRPETTTPRQLRNESDDEVVWLIVGAPPVVEAELWDEYDADGSPADEGEFTPLDEWL